MLHLESESGKPTPRQRILAGWRLAGAFLLVATTASMPRRCDVLYLVPAALLCALWAWCRMPFRYAGRRLLVIEPVILGLAFFSLFRPDSTPIVCSAVIKSNLCILTMLLLTYTTPFHELLQVLRRARVPAVMLTTLALMYRYLGVLAEESTRMQRARASRTFSRRRRLAWQNLAAIAGQLFLRTAARAERIYLAMCARGWK